MFFEIRRSYRSTPYRWILVGSRYSESPNAVISDSGGTRSSFWYVISGTCVSRVVDEEHVFGQISRARLAGEVAENDPHGVFDLQETGRQDGERTLGAERCRVVAQLDDRRQVLPLLGELVDGLRAHRVDHAQAHQLPDRGQVGAGELPVAV